MKDCGGAEEKNGEECCLAPDDVCETDGAVGERHTVWRGECSSEGKSAIKAEVGVGLFFMGERGGGRGEGVGGRCSLQFDSPKEADRRLRESGGEVVVHTHC
jgi:hypothetical protein